MAGYNVEFWRVDSLKEEAITRERVILNEIAKIEAANAAEMNAYNEAKTSKEDERKAEYEEKSGVKTEKLRHDGSTYLHAPGVELAYIEWTRGGRRGMNKFRHDLVLAVVWGRDDPSPPLLQCSDALRKEHQKISSGIRANIAEIAQLVQLELDRQKGV
jgi:hypothetical protein